MAIPEAEYLPFLKIQRNIAILTIFKQISLAILTRDVYNINLNSVCIAISIVSNIDNNIDSNIDSNIDIA